MPSNPSNVPAQVRTNYFCTFPVFLCDFTHSMRCRIYLKTSLPVTLPDPVEKIMIKGVPLLTSVENHP
jgi:hypothetical protein